MAKNKNESIAPIAQEGDLGSRLVELRESSGYSIPQIAEAMCLSEETITRLENEEFSLLAEPPYIRGYLRNYAKLADTDAEELINCYESLRGADPEALNYHFKTSAKIHSQHKKRMSPVFLQLFSLALLVGVLAGISMVPAVNDWIKDTWSSFSNQRASQSTATENPLLTGTMPVPSPLPVATDSNVTVTDTKETDSEATNQGNLDSTPETKAEESNQKTVENTSKPDTKVANGSANTESIIVDTDNPPLKEEARIPTSTDGTIDIKLVFNKEVWMRIRDGKKKTVFEGQNPSGQEKNLSLKKPLTFRVGNAQGLSLFVDGKAVDISSYIKGSVANFTLE